MCIRDRLHSHPTLTPRLSPPHAASIGEGAGDGGGLTEGRGGEELDFVEDVRQGCHSVQHPLPLPCSSTAPNHTHTHTHTHSLKRRHRHTGTH
eukprot:895962-Rhodomonas_salina.1